MKAIFFLLTLMAIIEIGWSQTMKKSELVTLNGHTVYYEVYGDGEPLFLLHGYTLSTKSWEPFIEEYSQNYEVYLVDLQGHGKSGPFKENLSIKSVAKDVDNLVSYLQLKSIYAVGFSYGGDVLFQLAIMRPELIKSMISIGACGIWQAKHFPDWIEHLSYKNIHNLKYMYEHQANDEQIRIILDQFPNYDSSMSDDEIGQINANTLIILGDKDDSIPLDYVSRVRKHLPHSYLWVLPNTGHGAHYGDNKGDFLRTSHSFFQGHWTSTDSVK